MQCRILDQGNCIATKASCPGTPASPQTATQASCPQMEYRSMNSCQMASPHPW